MKGDLAVVIGVFLSVGVLTGCGSTEMQKGTQHRVANMHKFMVILAGMEEGRGEKLGRSLDELESRHRRDVVQTGENPQKLKSRIEDDFANWEQQRPVLCRYIIKELAGHPEKIEMSVLEVLD